MKIPVTVFTGFLGAGKTTLISNLLRHCQGSRIVVLVNEFGKISIDGQALSKLQVLRRIEVIPLTSPLIAYEGDREFQEVLNALAERLAVPDHIIIETSGLAVPTAVLETLRKPEFKANFAVDATLDVVDTPLLLSNKPWGPSAEVFTRQLKASDVVILNKIDELTEGSLIAAESVLRSFAPSVRFLELAYHGELNPRVALGLRLNQPVATTFAHELVTVAGHSHVDGHKHSGIEAHHHGVDTHTHIHEHDPGWISFSLECKGPQNSEVVLQALQKLVAVEPVVRLKGTVASESGRDLIVHGVGDHIEIVEQDHSRTHRPSNDNEEFLQHQHGDKAIVFIGYHLNRQRVTALLQELTGTIWE